MADGGVDLNAKESSPSELAREVREPLNKRGDDILHHRGFFRPHPKVLEKSDGRCKEAVSTDALIISRSTFSGKSSGLPFTQIIKNSYPLGRWGLGFGRLHPIQNGDERLGI